MFATGAPLATSHPALFEQMNFLIGYMQDYHKLVTNSLLSEQHRLAQSQTAPQEAAAPLAQVVEANHRAQLRYVPRPYAGSLSVFTTQEQQAMYPLDPSLGWNMLSVEDVESIPIPGNHLNIFYRPQVTTLAEKLSTCLQQAQQGMAG
jgi:thioesterase domain-containing protein